MLVWYVDDNKLLHVNSEVVTTSILGMLIWYFGDLNISRGEKHSLLEMKSI